MSIYPICTTCGVQYEADAIPPNSCLICEDERQYVNPNGQSWANREGLAGKHQNIIEHVGPNLYSIHSSPSFGIGQRAHLLITPQGNILWDCVSLLDPPTVNQINALGGIKAIAISHPHYFATMMDWSRAFHNAPVYINHADADWLCRQGPAVQLWQVPELELWEGIKLVQCGGHFPGANILYVPFGKGSLLVGDVIQVCPDRKSVSFMYSYPNYIPLSGKEVFSIYSLIKDLLFDAIYGAFGHHIFYGGKEALEFSVKRYLKRIGSSL
jgi:glyoxylase-like metal-dependent hydrolase (beta-lactamase superfamily II)